MGPTNKRPTDSQLVGLRWSHTKVHRGILHIVRDSHSTKMEECSSCLERTMRSKCSGAKAKTGVRSYPHVAHEICVARSVNVCIPEKDWDVYTCNYPTHDLKVAAVLYALKIWTQYLYG